MSQSLQQVSRLITRPRRQRVETRRTTLNGGYLGLGRVIDVLKLITELKIRQARYANPLTLLPGNVPIQQCLTRLLQQKRESVICYVDIDSFKPFNDIYGYGRGDEVLLCLAQCLNDRVDPSRDFVGHIGGDDFLLVLGPEDWGKRLNQLLDDFQSQCRRFYRPEHLEAGCFIAPTARVCARSSRCCRCPSAWCTCIQKPAGKSTPASWRKWPHRLNTTRRMCRGIACM